MTEKSNIFTRKQTLLALLLISINCLSVSKKLVRDSGSRRLSTSYNEYDTVREAGLTCLLNALNDISQTYQMNSDTQNGLLNEGVDQSIDVNTLLLQYYHLKDDASSKIDSCNLNLDSAKRRCDMVYGSVDPSLKCTQVKILKKAAPFVTLKCPAGYQRNGCCRCTRICDAEGLIAYQIDADTTDQSSCVKKNSYESKMLLKNDYLNSTHGVYPSDSEYEGFGSYFVEKCRESFQRVGFTRCIAQCPLGWPDLGDRCHKKGDIVLMPFIWTIGDGQIKKK